ncbi:MAG TPA: amidase [Acidimicrobiales bacterium]|nr:amidase [Acidimicrobiales bacterium]
MTEPLDHDAVGQAELVRSGAVSPLELVDSAIARIEARNPELNAVIHERFDAARAEAAGDLPDGPFRGVPFLVKDGVCAMAGEPFHAGMAFLKRHAHVAARDQWLAERYRAAGFVVLGRTNLPELALMPTTEPAAYGPTRNPHDLERTPGGSSGGSAAAVADGWVAAAHGNDMGGSIRIPASCCGLVGLKPSRARTTIGPEFAEYWGQMTHEHVVCRSVRDTAAILDATAGPGPGDPYTAPPPRRPWLDEVGGDPGRLRIGVLTDTPFAEVDAECDAAARHLADELADAGHEVVDEHPAALADPSANLAYVTMLQVHVASELARIGRMVGEEITEADVEPETWAAAEAGRTVDAVSYWEATQAMHSWSRQVATWWSDHDLLVTPTLATLPPKLGEVDVFAMVAFTLPFNITGQPAISLPVHRAAGLPVGAQLVGAFGREDLVIAASSQVLPT